MARRGRRNNVDGGLHLPEGIIHHIQSFLDAKKAAQTGVLSKSWYSAWLTRPNLDLNEFDFRRLGGADPPLSVEEFRNFVRNTLQRYEDQNLRIETFGLKMHTFAPKVVSFSEEVITKAAKMGVKAMDLSSPLNIDLPQQVLEAENLVRLSVRGLVIERPPGGLVNYPRLKSLTLERLRLQSDCYTLMFPSLEDLTLRHCDVCQPIKILSSVLKFINLKNVTELVPSIHNFDSHRELRAKFDIPSICKFRFSGACYSTKLPMVTISTVSREWESDITLDVDSYLGKTWPQQLRRFMKKISQSKVYLCLNFDASVCCAYDEECKGKQGPLVENLMLSMPSVPTNIPRFLGGLFWSCPPKFITLFWFPGQGLAPYQITSNLLIRFLCKEVIRYREGPTKDNLLFGNLGLGKVSVEYFDDTCRKWRPILWKNFLMVSTSPRTQQKIRFQLEWNAPVTNVTRSGRKIISPIVNSIRGRRLQQLNPSAGTPVPANPARIQEIRQHWAINEVFSDQQPKINHYSQMINRMKDRMHLFFGRAAEHRQIQFPSLDGPTDPTSGIDGPPDNDVLDYVPPSDYPCIQDVLWEVLILLQKVQGEYARLLEDAAGMYARIDRIEGLLNKLQQRTEYFFNRVTEPLGIQFPPLDHPDDPTYGNYRPPGDA